jgi:hypothetical protein
MYRITIETIYNVIVLERDQYDTPELNEVYSQPYVKGVKIQKVCKVKKRTKINTKLGSNSEEV